MENTACTNMLIYYMVIDYSIEKNFFFYPIFTVSVQGKGGLKNIGNHINHHTF